MNVPAGWPKKKLGDLIHLVSGQHVEAALCNNLGQGVPYLTGPSDFEGIRVNATRYTTAPRTFSEAGDILITVKGSGTGKMVLSDNRYAISRQLMAIRAQNIDAAFLFQFLLPLEKMFSEAANGLIPGISRSEITDIQLSLPPLPEQRRIAAILSQWDDSLSILAKLIEAKRQQKRGLAEQLLTGKRRLKGFERDWEKKSLVDIAKPSSKKYDPKTSPDLPCIELEHLQSGTGKVLGYTRSKQQASTKNSFGPDNVLFGKLRPYLEKYAFPKFVGVCSGEIWVFQMNECTQPEYFFQLVQTKIFLDVANKASGSKMPRADWGLMQETVFSLPPLPEQRAIASILSTLDEEIATLNVLKAKVQEQKRGLMDVLLTGRVRVKVEEV